MINRSVNRRLSRALCAALPALSASPWAASAQAPVPDARNRARSNVRARTLATLLLSIPTLTIFAGSQAIAENEQTLRPKPAEISPHPTGVLFTIFRATYSPDGKYVAFLGSRPDQPSSFEICIYDAHTWQPIRTLPVPASPTTAFGVFDGGLSFSPDSNYIAFGLTRIYVWRLSDWTRTATLDGPYAHGEWASEGLLGLAFSPDGEHIAALYRGVFWPMGRRVETRAEAVALDEDARLRLSQNEDPIEAAEPVAMAFDLRSGRALFSSKLFGSTPSRYSVLPTREIAYSASGSTILVSGLEYPPRGSQDKTESDVFLVGLRSDSGVHDWSVHGVHVNVVTAFQQSSAHGFVATATNTGGDGFIYDHTAHEQQKIVNSDNIRVWDTASGKRIGEFGPIRGPVKQMRFTDDDQKLISCQPDPKDHSIVKVWRVDTRALVGSYRLDQNINNQFFTCAISPDGHSVVVPELGKSLFGRVQPDRLHVLDIR